jgi:Phospholipase_D-nuclease N-terminal
MGVMGDLLPLVLLLDLGVMVAALYDCITTDASVMRNLPKSGWILVILLFSGVGGLMWFIAGRPESGAELTSQPDTNHPAGRALRAQAASTDTEEMPRQPRRPVAPDDDPDFLRSLADTARRADEDRLRRWEADLRLREERLRRREKTRDEDEDE